jgi:hypothetical protein
MKHYSAGALERAVAASRPLLTEDRLLSLLRDRLDGTDTGRNRLARDIGVTPLKLSRVLRGMDAVPDGVAAALGFRRVARFERVD